MSQNSTAGSRDHPRDFMPMRFNIRNLVLWKLAKGPEDWTRVEVSKNDAQNTVEMTHQ